MNLCLWKCHVWSIAVNGFKFLILTSADTAWVPHKLVTYNTVAWLFEGFVAKLVTLCFQILRLKRQKIIDSINNYKLQTVHKETHNVPGLKMLLCRCDCSYFEDEPAIQSCYSQQNMLLNIETHKHWFSMSNWQLLLRFPHSTIVLSQTVSMDKMIILTRLSLPTLWFVPFSNRTLNFDLLAVLDPKRGATSVHNPLCERKFHFFLWQCKMRQVLDIFQALVTVNVKSVTLKGPLIPWGYRSNMMCVSIASHTLWCVPKLDILLSFHMISFWSC